ncbi:hypothetical protein [Pseudonocardia sp.]|uniref:hypothetical protein n=1 Tax=Pseudonocardia sp. TaxID=60912 RepID=UPI003D0D8C67
MTAPTPDEAAAPVTRTFRAAVAMAQTEQKPLTLHDVNGLARLLAAFDRCTTERDALRAEVERARDREQAVRGAARQLLDALTSEPVFTHREIAESERRTHQAVTSLRAALGPVETPQEDK